MGVCRRNTVCDVVVIEFEDGIIPLWQLIQLTKAQLSCTIPFLESVDHRVTTTGQ